ncbi:hypothetical protein EXIGLDRAFT_773982 [Exidia glandulosa HHB12029]|uniref:Chitinase n=1 Tax=Exidia glandulosa HHB12029 TaxID=1314781 RepID=A0A165EK59_EXIGL|nr:hypothetical protein EXIGLDRAFT_773982 [Exidia glandulosa HHB12029]
MSPQLAHPLFGRLWMAPDQFHDYAPLSKVSSDWDFIALNGADASANPFTFDQTGACFAPTQGCTDRETESQFTNAVQQKVAAGATINLALGTSPSPSHFAAKTGAELDGLVQSVTDIVEKYGFNGALMDCGPCEGDGPDKPTMAKYCDNVSSLVKKLRTALGPDFSLTIEHLIHQQPDSISNSTCTCPSLFTPSLQADIAYNFITWTYWFDSFPDLNGGTQYWNTTDGLAAVSDLFLTGVPGSVVPAIAPQKLVINNGRHGELLLPIEQAMSCVMESNDCQSYQTKAGKVPTFVGIPYWDFSINEDTSASSTYSTSMRSFLDALPGDAGRSRNDSSLLPSGLSSPRPGPTTTPTSSNSPTTSTAARSSHGPSRTTIAIAATVASLAVLVIIYLHWYFLGRRSRQLQRKLHANDELRPYGMVTPAGPGTRASSPRRNEKEKPSALQNDTTTGEPSSQPASEVSAGSSSPLVQSRHLVGDDSPEQINALRNAVRRAGFSVDALLLSLGRVHSVVPSAAASVRHSASSAAPVEFGSAESLPRYGECDRDSATA